MISRFLKCVHTIFLCYFDQQCAAKKLAICLLWLVINITGKKSSYSSLWAVECIVLCLSLKCFRKTCFSCPKVLEIMLLCQNRLILKEVDCHFRMLVPDCTWISDIHQPVSALGWSDYLWPMLNIQQAICKKNQRTKGYDLHMISHAGRQQICRSLMWSR